MIEFETLPHIDSFLLKGRWRHTGRHTGTHCIAITVRKSNKCFGGWNGSEEGISFKTQSSEKKQVLGLTSLFIITRESSHSLQTLSNLNSQNNN
jgi:hypothetical protein